MLCSYYCVRRFTCIILCNPPQWPWEVGIIPILQKKKLKYREVIKMQMDRLQSLHPGLLSCYCPLNEQEEKLCDGFVGSNPR